MSLCHQRLEIGASLNQISIIGCGVVSCILGCSFGSNEVGLGRTEGAAIAVVALVAIFNQTVDAGGLCLEIERLALVSVR